MTHIKKAAFLKKYGIIFKI